MILNELDMELKANLLKDEVDTDFDNIELFLQSVEI